MSSPPRTLLLAPAPAPGTEEAEEKGSGVYGARSRAYSYGEADYWDARYVEEGGVPYDWYQRYVALRPFVRRFLPASSRLLMVGCGSALMSEDMVNDGYMDIMNVDISSVVIEMMRKKYSHVPQLKYMQMDVRDMSFFSDESFDCAIDKGTLDSLMCGVDAPLSASRMILEVDRLLRPGGVFMLITYGDPSVRVPHLNQAGCEWKIILYILPRPGFKGCLRSILDPVPLTERGQLPAGFVTEDPDAHYIYVCKKMSGLTEAIGPTTNQVEVDAVQ